MYIYIRFYGRPLFELPYSVSKAKQLLEGCEMETYQIWHPQWELTGEPEQATEVLPKAASRR